MQYGKYGSSLPVVRRCGTFAEGLNTVEGLYDRDQTHQLCGSRRIGENEPYTTTDELQNLFKQLDEAMLSQLNITL